MKKTNLMALKAAIALAFGITASTTHTTDLYLENSYGAPIKYVLQNPKLSPQEYLIGTNLRSDSLGELRKVKDLYIRTTGKGSGYGLSPYHDLDYYLANLRSEESKHPNSNAIISVGPSYTQWDIKFYWERKDASLKTFSMKEETLAAKKAIDENTFLALHSAQARLEGIKSGLLGLEDAKKVMAICSADYSVARNKGMIDLCDQLQKSLVAPQYIRDPRATSQRPNISPTIEEIKNSIDSLNKSLTRYLSKGFASQQDK